MENSYYVYIRFDDTTHQVHTTDYLLAWEIYRMACKIYPNTSIIDLVDGTTGEVFQCNRD